MFGPASSTEAASRLAYNLRGRARGICSESSSRNDIPFARGITGEGEREAPSMSGSSHRARRHRRTQLQRSRPFLILNVPGKKRNNFFATTITRALSRVWTGWAVGAKLETPPPRGSFGPWITTSLYANRAGAGDFRGTLYYIASPCDIILCIDVHDRHDYGKKHERISDIAGGDGESQMQKSFWQLFNGTPSSRRFFPLIVRSKFVFILDTVLFREGV